MKSSVLLLALMVMMVFGGVNFISVVAMHDSTLDVNTWIASDNSTQLHTTDLNRGPISPAVSAGAATAEDATGPSTVTPTTPDGAEEDADEDEGEDEEEPDEDEDDE
ncbi:MAG: hypothetical protein M3219_00390 [Thermoproteota archaeon]|jgi:hypothetical protein|nr:hypothetical protein [Thermoproteota archaeon]